MWREYWERVRKMLWANHFWSPFYCVVSCGGASLDVVRDYIKNQQIPPSENAAKASKRLCKIRQHRLLEPPLKK